MTFVVGDDPFAHDDAAYVLGALEGGERLAFEEHLRGCDACRDRVAAAAATLPHLALLTPEDLAEFETPQPSRNRRRRRQLVLRAVAGGAVAAGVISAIVVTTSDHGSAPHHQTGGHVVLASQAMTAVAPTGLSASATLVARTSGTEIRLRCRQGEEPPASQSGEPADEWYTLLVYRRNGARSDLGSWTIPDRGATTYVTQTHIPAASIHQVVIAAADGSALLELTR